MMAAVRTPTGSQTHAPPTEPAEVFAQGGYLARPASLRLRRAIAQVVVHEDGAAIGGLVVAWGGSPHLNGALDGLPGRHGVSVAPPAVAPPCRGPAGIPPGGQPTPPRAVSFEVGPGQPLPLQDGAAGVALEVFGPQDTAEVQRLLASNGLLIVVVPTVAHLAELVRPLAVLGVTRRRPSRPAAAVGAFRRGITRVVSYQVDLDRAGVADLLGVDASAVRSVSARPTVTVSARISSYRAR